MRIVEYILDPQDESRSFHPKTIPSFITDGGYWFNSDGSEKMIGIGSDDGEIPDTMVVYTLEGLQVRQRAIHAVYPMKVNEDPNSDDMTDDQVNVAIKEWVDARS